jgi:hypothetical protein
LESSWSALESAWRAAYLFVTLELLVVARGGLALASDEAEAEGWFRRASMMAAGSGVRMQRQLGSIL